MKRAFLSLAVLGTVLTANAQSYSTDFESFTVGQFLAQTSADWTTWSGSGAGTSEDVEITNTDAHSGTKSTYYSTTSASGGPQDVVLPFGGAYSTGHFLFESWFKVEPNKGGYINFQSEVTAGVTWALECFMTDQGSLIVISDGSTVINSTYPNNTWFKMTWDIDLDLNDWEILIDGASKGSFANTNNKIASLDIFPVNSQGTNNNAGYWVDDVSFTYTPTTLPNLNAAVTNVDHHLRLTGQTASPTVTIRNLGQNAITSFDLDVNYNGNTITENVTGVNIASLDLYDVTFAGTQTAISGSNNVVATVSNVNAAGQDDNAADDTKTVAVDPVTPAPGKMVVAEEATGTWCGWCPRGTVAMYNMQEAYSQFWAGVAVHNQDPMVNADYDAGIGPLIGGYPSALVDRLSDIDPTQIEDDFLARIQVAPTAMLDATATWDGSTFDVDLDLTFQGSATNAWRVGVILTEHGVTGTDAQYGQTNYYSSQAQNLPLVGAGKDWQQEPLNIPASEMVYDHVARLIMPGFDGMANSFPSGASANDQFHFDFQMQLGAGWDKNNTEIIAVLFNANGEIDNATKILGSNVGGVGIDAPFESLFTMVPNPASDMVRLQLDNAEEAQVLITDMMGRVTYELKTSISNGDINIPIHELSSGVYLVNVRVGRTVSAQPLVIE